MMSFYINLKHTYTKPKYRFPKNIYKGKDTKQIDGLYIGGGRVNIVHVSKKEQKQINEPT